MDRLPVLQSYDPQVFTEFLHVKPVPNSPIFLNFLVLGILDRSLTPLQLNVGALLEDTVLEVSGPLHMNRLDASLEPEC